MKDSKITLHDQAVHLVDYGGEGEVVLCVHGLTANARCWDSVAERLTSHFRVLAIDLKGRGDSQKPDSGYSISQHTEDIKALIDVLGLEKVIYMGHSLGALIGVCFAATYPQYLSKLILVDGAANLDGQVFEMIRPAVERLGITYSSYQSYILEMKKNPFLDKWNEYIEQYFYSDVDHFPDGSVRSKVSQGAIKAELDSLEKTDINSHHKSIQTPTLLLWAQDSFKNGKTFMLSREKGKALAEKWPESRFVEIEGANHYSIIFNEYNVLVKEIKNFINPKML
ncbi:alpha/beta fold hydrolase [Pseudalkalibacillus caeni]|uniref:Alpha/beta hydrolase n=1 Tax=Exobacillus caeni TaxID=2574798 RepID=A0A5R9F8B8_9BACL|nr:alpha/beta hydrolase [Pseudalkalibacillus caeni]TLS38566.1 alpha/beta hydrolase [Pseudalkalibacillus caeni]